ncbi:unnamed protein product [Adineta ricciae]|uniref:Cullin family profile domain-containing protein n=1 Tax=Adineta ricciae TaxID=249248 RepID=A0A813YGF5_ADIRI|nr:unnamed protein product [Adineta ricciae]
MSTHADLLNQVWTDVSQTMDQMFALEPMTKRRMEQLYNKIDSYMKSNERSDALLNELIEQQERLREEAKKKEKKQDNATAAVATTAAVTPPVPAAEIRVPGGDLYYKTKDYLRQRLQEIADSDRSSNDYDFLRFYVRTWTKYQFLTRVINSILTPVHINWISRQAANNSTDVYSIHTTAMHIWQDIFFKNNQSLARSCLDFIRDHREGKQVDLSLVKEVVDSYVSAGFTEEDRANNQSRLRIVASLEIYRDYIEKPFLENTSLFYKIKSEEYLAENSVLDYIKKANELFSQEEDRTKKCLHETSLPNVQSNLTTILVQDKLETILPEMRSLLTQENITGRFYQIIGSLDIVLCFVDLKAVYIFLNRAADAHKPLQKTLKEYICKIGLDAVERVRDQAEKDPKIYIETLIGVYTRFSSIVEVAFCSNAGYRTAMNEACVEFINRNAVTNQPNKSSISAELLARYCDAILRKGHQARNIDVDKKIDENMAIFNYIEDKDIFQKFYFKLLAKRLVGQLSASDDYEELMITKLKEVCGFEYTLKFQRMFQDMRLSTNLISEFENYCEEKNYNNIVKFSFMVLTSNTWPLKGLSKFNLPIELTPTFESFMRFYATKFNGRKLEWAHHFSKGELKMTYTVSKNTVQVSTYQMAILLLFNTVDSMTVEAMIDTTQIERKLFLQVLVTLLKGKVLKCPHLRSNGEIKENDIADDFSIDIDLGFKNNMIRFSLYQPIRSIEQADAEATTQSIDEDRKIVIQAAIVRIMKARKDLQHSILIQETISQLVSRFIPKIPMIKKCIDILIEKEYLERDTKDRNQYRYLA